MANKILLASSILCGIINICLFLLCEYYCFIPNHSQCPSELRLIELLSALIIITSVLNHGYTNEYYKWTDCVSVYLALILTIHITWKYNLVISYFIIILSIGLYILAKCTDFCYYHVLIHILMTINNVIFFIVIPNLDK